MKEDTCRYMVTTIYISEYIYIQRKSVCVLMLSVANRTYNNTSRARKINTVCMPSWTCLE